MSEAHQKGRISTTLIAALFQLHKADKISYHGISEAIAAASYSLYPTNSVWRRRFADICWDKFDEFLWLYSDEIDEES